MSINLRVVNDGTIELVASPSYSTPHTEGAFDGSGFKSYVEVGNIEDIDSILRTVRSLLENGVVNRPKVIEQFGPYGSFAQLSQTPEEEFEFEADEGCAFDGGDEVDTVVQLEAS